MSTISSVYFLSLVRCVDIEANHGTVSTDSHAVYLCSSDKEPVMWDDKVVMCKYCDVWYHFIYQIINNSLYSALGSRCVVWTFPTCGGPNYGSAELSMQY